jgi:hypothetical protein
MLAVPPAYAASSGSCPTTESCIVVHVLGPSGFTQTVSLADIEDWHDIAAATYDVRSSPKQAPISQTFTDLLSIRTLLAHLTPAVDPASLSEVYLDKPDAAHTETTVLAPTDLGPAGGNGYADGLMPAVYNFTGGSIGYVRPLRTSDPSDVNGVNDFWNTQTPGEPVQLYVQTTGHLLSPSILASPGTVAIGKSTSLSVQLPGHPDTTGWTFAWDLAGTTSSLPAPLKAWTTPGTLPVSVTIDAPDGSHGYAQTTVKVTGPPTHKPPPTTGHGSGANSNPHAPSTGPDQGSGTTTQQSTAGVPTLPTPATPATPAVPGVLSATPVPDIGASTPPGLANVVGTVLVNADGTVPGSAAGGSTSTLTLHTAGAHHGKDGIGLRWLWWLLLPALLIAGAASELRPWSRHPALKRRFRTIRKRHA